MIFIEGTLLHKKSFKSKKGQEIPVVSLLDKYDSHSQVIDITDFDNQINGLEIGKEIRVPVKSRAGVSDRGNAYINYVSAGVPTEVM